MVDNLDIPSDFFTKFNNINYYDEPHKYYINDKELISVTTLIHKYEEEFDEDYWSQYKAEEFNLSQREVLRAWKFINKKGTIKGSAIHDYCENLFLNKIFKYPKEIILNEFGFDPVWNEYQITKKHVDRFYSDSRNKLIPIRTEFVVYDEESLIAGMMDIVFYNVKAKEYQIWDNKTNKELRLENKKQYLLGDLCTLEDSDLEIYSLQLGLYKYIIEKNTNIKIGKCYLAWFSHNNESYKIIPIRDRSYYVNIIVENRINEIKGR